MAGFAAPPGSCVGNVTPAVSNRVFFRAAASSFWIFCGRYLDLNGVDVVGPCSIHGNYSKTAIGVASLNRSCGLRSGRTWAHRVGTVSYTHLTLPTSDLV